MYEIKRLQLPDIVNSFCHLFQGSGPSVAYHVHTSCIGPVAFCSLILILASFDDLHAQPILL